MSEHSITQNGKANTHSPKGCFHDDDKTNTTAILKRGAIPFSLLHQLPEDPSQVVLSYLNLHNMLQLSLASKHLRHVVATSHTLFLPESREMIQNDIMEDNTTNNSTNTNRNERRHIEVDPAYCHRGNQHMGYILRSITGNTDITPATRSFNKSIPVMSLQHISTLTSLQQVHTLLGRFQHLRHLTLHKLNLLEDKFLSLFKNYPSTPLLITLQLFQARILPHHDSNASIKKKKTLNLNNLQHIVVSGTIYDADIASMLISSSQNFKTIELQGFRTLTDNHLLELFSSNSSNSNNESPHTNNKRMSMVTKLQCKDFTQIKHPTLNFPSLLSLNLSQSGIQSLSHIHCPKLIELDLSSCSYLTDDVIASFISSSPSAQHLEIVKLKACRGFQHLNISSKSLKTLDVTLCTLLQSLEIDCDNLIDFQAQTCLILQSFVLHPTRHLEVLDLSLLPKLQTLTLLDTPELHTLNLSGCCALTNDGVEISNNEKLTNVHIYGTGIRCYKNECKKKVACDKESSENDEDEDGYKIYGQECVLFEEYHE